MKKILIALGVLVVLAAIGLPLAKRMTKSHSPAAEASFQDGGWTLKVAYARPAAKGRLIFGAKDAGALVRYGEYWRVGANEATTFETSADILFNGKELKAGKYALYAIPGPTQWTIALNQEWDRWSYRAPDTAKDVLRIEVPADNAAEKMESLEITLPKSGAAGEASLVVHWDKTKVIVPLRKK